MTRLFNEFRPDVVVHAACSYKDPDDWYNDTLTNCVRGPAWWIWPSAMAYSALFIFKRRCVMACINRATGDAFASAKPGGSGYAISKTANELYLVIWTRHVTFRLANVVGPRNVAGPLPIFYQRLRGKQCFVTESRRDFVFVSDLAKTVVKACDGAGSGAYHFSSGSDVAITELYDEVVKAME